MTFLIRIQQPAGLPQYVRSITRSGELKVTFDIAHAQRFPAASPSILRRVNAAVRAWPEPGHVSYLQAPI